MSWLFKREKAQFADTPENRAYAATTRAAMEGFLARDESASRTLVELLTPLLYKELADRHREWLSLWDEVQARCFESLVVWRHDGRLEVSEPLPFLSSRLLRQTLRTLKAEEKKQERNAEAWVAEPRPASPQADRVSDAKRLMARLWDLAKEKLSGERIAAIEAFVLEEGGGPPIEESLKMTRDSAQKRVRRAQAELWRLAEEAGLLEDAHWEEGGNLRMTETQCETDEDNHD